MNPTDRTTIEQLMERIKLGTATYNDLLLYEKMLLNLGLPKGVLSNELRKIGFTSLSDYIKYRETLKQGERMDSVIIGGLVGLGLGLLIYSALKDR